MAVNRYSGRFGRYVFFAMLALFMGAGALLVLASGSGTAQAALPATKSRFQKPAVPEQVNATFVVTNTADSGPGSLRQAIISANQSAGPDAIEFDISPAGVHTITPLSALPKITDTVLIDGYSQEGATPNTLAVGDNAQLKIVLNNGGNLGTYGLWLEPDVSANSTPSGSEIRGMVISGFGNAIRANSAGGALDEADKVNVAGPEGGETVVYPNNIWIHGNFLGTNVTGTAAQANLYGVQFLGVQTSTIGGGAAANRNLISGNDMRGVSLLNSTGISVLGNYVGTDASGMSAVPNGYAGVEVIGSISTTIGGPTQGERNVISGNLLNGIELYSSNVARPANAPEGVSPSTGATMVLGNYIGVGADGTVRVSNDRHGIDIYTPNLVLVGGMASGEGNVISGNTNHGIFIRGSQLPSSPGDAGPQAPSGGSGFTVVVTGNKIGTDYTGSLDVGNGNDGIHADSPVGVLVGVGSSGLDYQPDGTGPQRPEGGAAGGMEPGFNLISGNASDGIEFTDVLVDDGAYGPQSPAGDEYSNYISGNFIGTNISGTAAISNTDNGIYLFGNEQLPTVIGGRVYNLISGNGGNGIVIEANNTLVLYNGIGTSITFTEAIPNREDGVLVLGSNNDIGAYDEITGPGLPGGKSSLSPEGKGGDEPANIISGNQGDGIQVAGATNTRIFGNAIGTDMDGMEALPNGGHGVNLMNASNTQIGTSGLLLGNLISGNEGDGININPTTYARPSGAPLAPQGCSNCRHSIQGNRIGTDASTEGALGNGGAGIRVIDATDTTIGAFIGKASAYAVDPLAAEGGGYPPAPLPGSNVIAHNGEDGVVVTGNPANGSSVIGNEIYLNGEATATDDLGIDLANDGVTLNDNCDPDVGPNTLLNFPVIQGVAVSGTQTIITGTVNTITNTEMLVHVYSNIACDPSGYGEGQTPLGIGFVSTTADSCTVPFTVTLDYVLPGNLYITALLTNEEYNTSEFSACYPFGIVPTTATPTASATGTVVPPSSTATTIPSTSTAVPSSTSTVAASSTVVGATSTPMATATVCTVNFPDNQPGDTFYEYIQCLACRGIVTGYPDGMFHAERNITRGQISKMVSNAAGFNEDPGPQIYQDVPPGSTYYAYINRLTNRGIMSGYPCPERPEGDDCDPDNPVIFLPNANATRGQLAKIVSNAAGYNEPVSGQFYADVPPAGQGTQFYEWIMRLTNRGVMSGYACGGPGEPCDGQNRPYFRWNVQVTRGQASKIVANTFFPNCEERVEDD
ncbi:MAG TPA: S-layer homology domain-containing protein [Chloroflexia bacterium]